MHPENRTRQAKIKPNRIKLLESQKDLHKYNTRGFSFSYKKISIFFHYFLFFFGAHPPQTATLP